jgi:filamentous hemagglutinin
MEDALVQHLRIDPAAPSLAQAEQAAGAASELSQPAAQDGATSEALSEDHSRKPDWHDVFEDLKIPEGLREPPSVVGNAVVNGVFYADTNQHARSADRAREDHKTLAFDHVTAKHERDKKKGKTEKYPNGNMADAHAEIGIIQQAYEEGNTQGHDMVMKVRGREFCSYCRTDVIAAARKAGLKSLTVNAIDRETNLPTTYYWKPGMRGWEIRR